MTKFTYEQWLDHQAEHGPTENLRAVTLRMLTEAVERGRFLVRLQLLGAGTVRPPMPSTERTTR
jgi:hypothetical protein